LVIVIVAIRDRARAHYIIRAMDGWTGGVQFAAERVVIGILGVIGFGMRIRSGADILEIAPLQGRFIGWQ
jgi:hypothetical protein